MARESILQPGRNCWRTARADRYAFLVDGEAYFARVDAALSRARRSVLIVGWDLDSRMALVRDDPGSRRELPAQLGPLLDALVRRRRDLKVHILLWDYAMIYVFERQVLPRVNFGWRTARNVQIRLDGNHPLGASHHQKLVIIDDRVAFTGGIDLTDQRWDTPEHLPDDPRRASAAGETYQPFHDVQVILDGTAAVALADVARARWLRATSRRLPVPDRHPADPDPWPPDLQPDLRDLEVGVARTMPAVGAHDEVREVEQLFVDAIRSARRQIYIENQFLSATRIGEELARSLARAEGPEVLIVGPQHGSGWLEKATMVVLRSRMARQLREADRHGRLRMVYPVQPGLSNGHSINVHSKVMLVDDRLALVGSANLSNRSMGLDTECVVAAEVSRDEQRRSLLSFRHRLLAEHLGREPEEVARAIAQRGLLGGVASLSNPEGRTLQDLEHEVPEWVEELVPESEVVDPEQPFEYDAFVGSVIPHEFRNTDRAPLLTRLHLWTALSALLIAWPLTFLEQLLPMRSLLGWGLRNLEDPWVLLVALGIFVIGAPVPLNLLTVTIVFLFSGSLGLILAPAGVLLVALAGFGLGWLVGRERLRRYTDAPLDRLGNQLARARIITLAKARWLPLTSFHLLNLASGGWPVSWYKFLLGILFGVFPGTLFTVLFASQLKHTMLEPGGWNGAALLLLLGAMYGLTMWLHRRLTG